MLEKQIEMQQKIETYIREGLPPHQEDDLWVKFLKDEKWYWYFIIVLSGFKLGINENTAAFLQPDRKKRIE